MTNSSILGLISCFCLVSLFNDLLLTLITAIISWSQGNGWSTVVEHMLEEQNSKGRGFDFFWVLGFFVFFLSLSGVSLIRFHEEVQLYWFFLNKNGYLAVQLGAKLNLNRFGKDKLIWVWCQVGANRAFWVFTSLFLAHFLMIQFYHYKVHKGKWEMF